MSNLFAQIYEQQNQALAEILDFGRNSLAVEALSSVYSSTTQALMQSADSQFAQLHELLPEQNPFESLGISQSKLNGFAYPDILEQTEITRNQLDSHFAKHEMSAHSPIYDEFTTRMANQAQALSNSLGINEARETALSSLSSLHQLAQPDSAIELAVKEAINATTHGVRSAFDRLNHVGKSIEKTLALGDGFSALMTEHQDQIDRLARTALDQVNQAGVPRQLLEDVLVSGHLQTEINSILNSFSNVDLERFTNWTGVLAERKEILDRFQEGDLEIDDEIIEATSNQIFGFLLILVNFPFPENTPMYVKIGFWIAVFDAMLGVKDRVQDHFNDKGQIQIEAIHAQQTILPTSFVAHSDIFIHNNKNLISRPAAKIPKGTSYEIVKYMEVSDKVNFNDEMGLPQTGYIKKIRH